MNTRYTHDSKLF